MLVMGLDMRCSFGRFFWGGGEGKMSLRFGRDCWIGR